MIDYSETKEDLLKNIHDDLKKIEKIETICQNKIEVFGNDLIYLNKKIQAKDNTEALNNSSKHLKTAQSNLVYYMEYTKKIKRNKKILNKLENEIYEVDEEDFDENIEEYNQKYQDIKKIINQIYSEEEKITIKNIEKNIFEKTKKDKITEDNNTLLISEVQNKIILPYKISELRKILNSKENKYNNIKSIVDEKYTIPLTHYKFAIISRYKEAYSLMRDKEKASLLDSIDLALEIMKKRFVHPAIIRACQNLDQLDIYLDCLETNKLDDFPFFEIKYELNE